MGADASSWRRQDASTLCQRRRRRARQRKQEPSQRRDSARRGTKDADYGECAPVCLMRPDQRQNAGKAFARYTTLPHLGDPPCHDTLAEDCPRPFNVKVSRLRRRSYASEDPITGQSTLRTRRPGRLDQREEKPMAQPTTTRSTRRCALKSVVSRRID